MVFNKSWCEDVTYILCGQNIIRCRISYEHSFETSVSILGGAFLENLS